MMHDRELHAIDFPAVAPETPLNRIPIECRYPNGVWRCGDCDALDHCPHILDEEPDDYDAAIYEPYKYTPLYRSQNPEEFTLEDDIPF